MPILAISTLLAIFILLHQSGDAFYMQKNSHGTTVITTGNDKKSIESPEDYYTEDESVTTLNVPEKYEFFVSFPKGDDSINEVEYIEESPAVALLLQKKDVFDTTNIEELIIEGDIILNSKQELLYMTKSGNPFMRSALSSKHKLWPDGVIPYTISDDFSETQRNSIIRAMDKFHDNTCLTFIPKTEDHNGYVDIFQGSGCSSNVGRVGGRQSISLASGCLGHGTILHELMHTAGFWHEQSRYDRDDYIDIAWDNIQSNRKHNFNKHSNGHTTTLDQAYDYNSLMHYNSRAFAIDRSQPTIIPKDPEAKIGNRRDFSELDKEGLNLLYNCGSPSTNTTAAISTTTATTTTTTSTTTTVATTTSPDQSCTNSFSKCQEWADIGTCEKYTYFMMKFCKQSCNACDDKACDDEHDKCATWASQGHCTRTEKYMLKYCKRSCDQCN